MTDTTAATPHFSVERLEGFAAELFTAAGMDAPKAATLARLLVLTDAMGRRTHGLAMAPLYLADIRKGGMRISGAPEVVKDNGISAVWDGDYLPGLWLMSQAIETAIPRAAQHGLAAIAALYIDLRYGRLSGTEARRKLRRLVADLNIPSRR